MLSIPVFNPLGAMQHSMRVVAVEVSGEVAGSPVVCGTLHDGLVLGDGPRNLHGTRAYPNNARVRLLSPMGVRRHGGPTAFNRSVSTVYRTIPTPTGVATRHTRRGHAAAAECIACCLRFSGNTRPVADSIQRAMDAGTDSVVFPLLDGDPACLDTSIRSLLSQRAASSSASDRGTWRCTTCGTYPTATATCGPAAPCAAAPMIRPRFSGAKNSATGTVPAMVPKKRLVCS